MLIPRDLSTEECIHRLSSRNVGRLAVATPLGPRIYPVNYVVDDVSVVFRTNPYGTLGTFGWGLEVAFEVDQDEREHQARLVGGPARTRPPARQPRGL